MISERISREILNEEYMNWLETNGNGKNQNGERFGQYIENNYGVNGIGYYEEKASDADRLIYIRIKLEIVDLCMKFIENSTAKSLVESSKCLIMVPFSSLESNDKSDSISWNSPNEDVCSQIKHLRP